MNAEGTTGNGPGNEDQVRDESLVGQCLCGTVKFRIAPPLRDIHHCHCTMCRRATGSAFATLVWVKRAAVTWDAEPVRYRSSKIAQRGFCGRCGSPLTLEYDGSGEIAIMIGAFKDAERLRPTHHYGTESRLTWADIQTALPGRPTDPDPRPK